MGGGGFRQTLKSSAGGVHAYSETAFVKLDDMKSHYHKPNPDYELTRYLG